MLVTVPVANNKLCEETEQERNKKGLKVTTSTKVGVSGFFSTKMVTSWG